MRRFMTVPLAGLIALAVAGPVAAGPNVGNFSNSATIAQASWDGYDEATETYRSGFVAVSKEQGSSQAFAEYSQYQEQFVQCTGADTPDDPDDDSFGVISSNTWGYGPASLAVARNYSSASADGTLDAAREDFNECTGEWTYEELPDLAFSLDLTATSATVKESGRGSFHLPGEFNSHSSYKAAYRFAEGTLDGIDGSQAVSGMIGKVTWMEHTNG